jgi:hypothetical protein
MEKVKTQPLVFVIFSSPGENDIRKPWVEVKAQELYQHGRMLCSDDQELSNEGKKQLKAVAQELHDLKMEIYLERLLHEETRQKLSPAGKKGAENRWHKNGSRWGENNELHKIIASLAATTDRWVVTSSTWSSTTPACRRASVMATARPATTRSNSKRTRFTSKRFGNRVESSRGRFCAGPLAAQFFSPCSLTSERNDDRRANAPPERRGHRAPQPEAGSVLRRRRKGCTG